ncbi:MAG TPA: hypothetical protein VFB16_03905, partial [Bauldia sp.]|nr:hypothetical protein [Bauldia sp.]
MGSPVGVNVYDLAGLFAGAPGQSGPHATQAHVPPGPLHCRPTPQLSGWSQQASFGMQTPWQSVRPASQTHVPLSQRWLSGQTLPQAPQLFLSLPPSVLQPTVLSPLQLSHGASHLAASQVPPLHA